MKIGIIKEGKKPIDRRVALSPEQCVQLKCDFPQLNLVVQPSPIRCFSDQDYLDEGVTLQKDLSDCDLITDVEDCYGHSCTGLHNHTGEKRDGGGH